MKCSRKVPADFIGVFMSIVITKRRCSALSLIASGRDSALFSITLQTFRTSYWARFYYSLNLLKNFSYHIYHIYLVTITVCLKAFDVS